MRLTVKDFEGPLDLLLHLIKTKKQDIYDIDINIITKEYLNFIEQNKNLTIDASSEYLVMASELIHLKSKTLLNNHDEDSDEEYEFQNPDELAARLIEYDKIKSLAINFKELEAKRGEVYTTRGSLEHYEEIKRLPLSDVSLNDLLTAFEGYLKRAKGTAPLNTHITQKEISVEQRCSQVRKLLTDNQGRVKFTELFDDLSKGYVITTFLAILSMAKNHEIKIMQKNNFADIYVELEQ